MKSFFCLLICFILNEISIAQVLDPKWMKVADKDSQSVFLDTTNIKHVNGQLTVVSLLQFNKPKLIRAYGKEAGSIKSQLLFDIAAKKYTVLGTLYYDNLLKIIGESALPGFSIGDESFGVPIDSNDVMKVLFEKSVSLLSIDTSKYLAKGSTIQEEKFRSLVDNTISTPNDSPKTDTQMGTNKFIDKNEMQSQKDTQQKDATIVKTDSNKNDEKSKTVNSYDIRNEKNIAGAIFSDGNLYCLQISSWKYKSQAEREVARLKKLGHDAYIVEANIPSKGGKWFRVRIGFFESLEETQAFSRSNNLR